MGDISELRGLIVVVSFLGACALLFAFIPTEFYAVGEERETDVPNLFEAMDIYAYAETKSFWMNESGGWVSYIYGAGNPYYGMSVDLGNWDIDFYYKPADSSFLDCSLLHKTKIFFGLFPTPHELDWKLTNGQSKGVKLSVEEMQEIAGDTDTIFLRPKCKHTTYDVYFAYNSSIYSDFTEAWNSHGLAFFAGVNFDQVNTSYNAWNLIATLLWFKMPNMPFFMQALLSIPIWVCIGYLVYILILRAIGAIFGGGA